MIKKVAIIGALVLAGAGIANAGTENKVLICHATSSETNEIVPITVSPNAVEAQLEQGSSLAKQLPDGTYTCTIEIAPL